MNITYKAIHQLQNRSKQQIKDAAKKYDVTVEFYGPGTVMEFVGRKKHVRTVEEDEFGIYVRFDGDSPFWKESGLNTGD